MDGWMDGWVDGWMDGWSDHNWNRLTLHVSAKMMCETLCLFTAQSGGEDT